MAIFKRSQKKNVEDLVEPVKVAEKKLKTPEVTKSVSQNTTTKIGRIPDDLSRILLRPRITEKASIANEKRVYVFEVSPRATKKTVSLAVQKFYKVSPIKINITKIPAKKRISQMRRVNGVKSGGKKAYVFLKEGDSISFI